MSTSFSSLPVVSLSALSSPSSSPEDLAILGTRLDEVFSTTGFAYLTDLPLTFTHDEVFGLCNEFFEGLSMQQKMKLAKKTFVKDNVNTYRGYFPPQEGIENLKEGFELGTPENQVVPLAFSGPKFNLTEPNIFPSDLPAFRKSCETLHNELQYLASILLSLLAVSLGKQSSFFAHYLANSLSTLRLLHYPPVPAHRHQDIICTPHTDSGIMTLLHQDPTGGLEVRNSDGEWIPAPYIPGSMVVNIGDLMAKISGGRWIATFHRVRSTKRESDAESGRFSVPFFFEPGIDCVIESVGGDKLVYGEHVLEKMKQWVEFQDVVDNTSIGIEAF